MCEIIVVGVFMLWVLSWELWLLLSIVAEFNEEVVSKLFLMLPINMTFVLGLTIALTGGCAQ